jgi:glycosyltransferase involved in cell wall biosynthesis
VTDGVRVAFLLEQCWHAVPGGTARSTLESLRALQDIDDVELAGFAARHRRPPSPEWRPGVPVHMLPLPRNVLYETWHYLRAPKVQCATGPVDVIHATGGAIPPKSAPLVVTVHDLAFVHDPSHFTRHGVRFFNRSFALTRRHADVVVVPSQSTFDDCVAFGVDRERLRLVPWGVDLERVGPDQVEAARRRHGLERPYVLWTGTLEPRKNLRNLLAAFTRLDTNVALVLVGPTGWKEDVASLVEPLGDKVVTLGFLPPNELPAVYAGAEVFCFPSLREGFGLPVLEAMAQGTPVVTSAGTSTAEVVGEAAVLVDPHDIDAIAHGLHRVLTDSTFATSLGEASLRRAAMFTWDRCARSLAAVYRELAS